MKATSANGRVGCLYRTLDGGYGIRVYDAVKLGTWQDYEIMHSDLFFQIQDEDSYLYEDESGRCWIDHSPATLGKQYERKD